MTGYRMNRTEQLLQDRGQRFNAFYNVYGQTLKQARARDEVWKHAPDNPNVPHFALPFEDREDR